MKRLEGVLVATVTPFDRHGAVDAAALQRHLEFLADAGVDGFVPCGTTGEASVLTADEWRFVVKTTQLFAASRKLKTIAGCGSNNTAAVVKLTQEAKDLGCDAALVVTPYYNKPTAAGTLAHYEQVADHGGLPVILYNVPGRTNVSITLEMLRTLLKHENILGIKEASGNYLHWLAIAHTFDLAKKSLLAGDDDAFAAMQALGGAGIISASANAFPKPFVAIYRAAREGKWPLAMQWQTKLYPVVKAMFAESNPAPVKYALEKLGFGVNHLRLPLVSVTAATREMIDAAMVSLSQSAGAHDVH